MSMYNSPDANVPVVTNSRYSGHGFTEEGNSNDLQGDETIHNNPVYQYYDMNNDTFGYSHGTDEHDRLLSPSDATNPLYYQNSHSSKINKLTQLYRRSIGQSVSYDATNTSHIVDSAVPNTYSADFYSRYIPFPHYNSNFMRNVGSKGSEYLNSTCEFLKAIFITGIRVALGFLLGVAIVSLFFSAYSHFDTFNLFFANSKRKTDPPPSKPPVTKENPPRKPGPVFEPVYFKDILGIDEAKEDIMEIVKFIKKPHLYKKVGAKIPKGILLVGAPGTGKTMLAKAVATETGVPFIYTSGPEFIEIFVGQGAQRIRALFHKARSLAPCIIFIDEIDAVGAKRGGGSFSGQNREHDQTLNQLLVEMDGFNVSSGITIIAATNRLNVLDKALLRPGRFDRVVHIPLPSIKGREQILNYYLKQVNYDKDSVNVKDLAKITPGYSGADLKNLVNEAALITVRQDRTVVGPNDLFEARDKIIMGNKRNLLMPELERKMTAYHEAGHALVAYYLYPNTDPIHKATIITRGTALGFVEQLPNDEYDKSSYKLIEMKSRLAVCMAGRLSEKLVFGYDNMTSGASSDIVMATDLAYKMITHYGMSDKLASLNFHNLNNLNNKLSSELNVKIENEIIKLIKEAEHLAESILRSHRKQLELLATELLKYETLTGEQITTIIKSNKPLNLEPTPPNEPETKDSDDSDDNDPSAADVDTNATKNDEPPNSDGDGASGNTDSTNPKSDNSSAENTSTTDDPGNRSELDSTQSRPDTRGHDSSASADSDVNNN